MRRKLILYVVYLSLFALVLGFGYNVFHKEKLANSKVEYCYEFRKGRKKPVIIVLDDFMQKKEYSDYFVNYSTQLLFSFTVLEEGAKVYVLEYSQDSLLVRIGHDYRGFSRTQGGYNEYWIWHEYLQDSAIPPSRLPNDTSATAQ